MAARDAQVRDYDRMAFLHLLGQVEIPLTQHALGAGPSDRLLEAGCGTGRMTRRLAQETPGLVAMDFSLESLRVNRRKLRGDGLGHIPLVQGDLCHLPFVSGTFDRVVSCQVLEHVPGDAARRRAVSELARVVRPGGTLALSAYKHSLWTRAFAEKEGQHEGGIPFFRFTRRELRALLATAFEVRALRAFWFTFIWPAAPKDRPPPCSLRSFLAPFTESPRSEERTEQGGGSEGATLGTAYTPGLKVSPHTTIRRTRRLPLKGEVLVQAGQAVTPDTVVARAALPGLMQSVKVAAQLGIDPEDLPDALLVKEGDVVEKGQVLARTKSFFGMFTSEAKSSASGTVETVSAVSGNVGVRQAPSPIELTAYLSGTIAEVLPGEGVVVQAQGALAQGIFGIGGERVGEIRVVSRSPDADLTESDLSADLTGKIIIGGANVSGAALRRAAELGVRGIVVGGIVDVDLIAYLGYDIGVAITGHENIPLTLVITEGFGTIAMARRTYDLLASLAGRSASINGATQIRAGVIRPEVIVPLPSSPAPPEWGAGGASEGSLAVGTPIRIIREPYFGALAAVSALPPQLTVVDSGASVRVLEARLPDGRVVTVPRANVEIIETI